jgi:hypothetical protein
MEFTVMNNAMYKELKSMTEWKHDKNMRAEAIVRVSSANQGDNTSHEIQEREIREYCRLHELNLVKVFKLTESAKNSDARKQYKVALDYASTEGVRHLLFYMQDRESRNLRDLEDNEDLVKQGKIVLHYVRDRKVLDKDTPESDFFNRDIQGAMNKQYSRVLASKVKDAQKLKAENGWFPGGRLPLGYVHIRPKDENGKEIKRAPTTVIPDPDFSMLRLVRREFELKAQGLSLDIIRETILKDNLVPPSLIKHYGRTEIDGRLHNKFYWGGFNWDGVEYVGKHDLVIPRAHLDAVKLSFERKGRGGSHSIDEAVFSGLLRCGNSDCGCLITFEKKRKTIKETGEMKVYPFYRCGNSKKVHKSLKGMYATEEVIWDQLEDAVGTYDLSKELAQDILAALNETQKKAVNAHRREAKMFADILVKLDQRNDQLFDMLSAKSIGEEEYRRQVKRIQAERMQVSGQLEQATIAISDAMAESTKEIFELATNAKLLWKKQGRVERLVMLKRVCSNQVLDGQTLRYDLKKPFILLGEMKGLQDWSPLLVG